MEFYEDNIQEEIDIAKKRCSKNILLKCIENNRNIIGSAKAFLTTDNKLCFYLWELYYGDVFDSDMDLFSEIFDTADFIMTNEFYIMVNDTNIKNVVLPKKCCVGNTMKISIGDYSIMKNTKILSLAKSSFELILYCTNINFPIFENFNFDFEPNKIGIVEKKKLNFHIDLTIFKDKKNIDLKLKKLTKSLKSFLKSDLFRISVITYEGLHDRDKVLIKSENDIINYINWLKHLRS